MVPINFNVPTGYLLIKNSSCEWLCVSWISYCKLCNWKRHTSKYFTEKNDDVFVLNTLYIYIYTIEI